MYLLSLRLRAGRKTSARIVAFGLRFGICFLSPPLALAQVQSQQPVNVLAWHGDDARTGQNLRETQLTLANVNTNTFGKLFAYPVDGFVYAQPLFLAGVNVPGLGQRNLVFVATEHDSVYAFNADDGVRDGNGAIWHASFTDPTREITSVPTSDAGISEPSELGITGTPVIDPASGTLYVVAHTKEMVSGAATYPQRLHALDVATGQEKFGGPTLITATTPGTGSNTDGSGKVLFDDLHEFQRPGLALFNGIVYVAFASAGDVGPYHGWVLGFDAHTLQPTNAFNATPNGYEAGIWMSGAAPSIDPQGSIYCITGNGDYAPDKSDFGDSFLKLTPTSTNLVLTDYFTPYNQEVLDASDGDLGSGGALILPDSVGSTLHPHLLIGCGKEGTIYLIDRDNMGHFNAGSDAQIVQSLPHGIHGVWGNPAYYNGWVYYQGSGDTLDAFAIANGQLSTQPVSKNSQSVWSYPGGTPSISANGTNDAIVWLLQTDTFYQGAPAILHAYNATNLEEEIYNSNQAATRDQPGLAQKFSVPVVANGKVFVPGGSLLTVYGNLGAPQITIQPASQAGAPGSSISLQVSATGAPPLSYQWFSSGAPILNATGAVLVLTNVSSVQSSLYSVSVSNSYGTTTSDTAAILVVSAPTLAINSDQQFTLTGPGGVTYAIEAADTLGGIAAWQPVTQVTLPGDPSSPDLMQASFNDPTSGSGQRFYRASVQPPDPTSAP